MGHHHVVVRWSDGSSGRALSYFADEILVTEGDHGNSGLMSGRLRSPRIKRCQGLVWGT